MFRLRDQFTKRFVDTPTNDLFLYDAPNKSFYIPDHLNLLNQAPLSTLDSKPIFEQDIVKDEYDNTYLVEFDGLYRVAFDGDQTVPLEELTRLQVIGNTFEDEYPFN